MAWTDLFYFHYNGSFDQCWIQKLAGTTTKLIIKVSALSMKISYQCPWKIGAWTTFSRGENESLSFRDQVLSRSLASIFFWWLFDKLDTHEQYFGQNYEINHHCKYLQNYIHYFLQKILHFICFFIALQFSQIKL